MIRCHRPCPEDASSAIRCAKASGASARLSAASTRSARQPASEKCTTGHSLPSSAKETSPRSSIVCTAAGNFGRPLFGPVAQRPFQRNRHRPGEAADFGGELLANGQRADAVGAAKARAGELRNFTGVDSPYEVPLDPELHLRTEKESVDALAKRVVEFLDRG